MPNRGKGEQSIPSGNFLWKLLVDLSLVEVYKEKMRYFGYFVCGVTIGGVTNYIHKLTHSRDQLYSKFKFLLDFRINFSI